MNVAEKEAHALLMLQHATDVHATARIRVAWITKRQQWVAHYIGKPDVEGYGHSATEAIAMLKQRTRDA